MWTLTGLLTLVWALTLLYGEWFSYMVPSMWTCSWPHQSSSSPNGAVSSSDYVKIAVVADPQLMDRTSHSLAPKSLALEIAQFYTDLYMRRAFLSAVLPLNPDVILFMGDYFDGGYILSDDEWQESLGRIQHIFNLDVLRKMSSKKIYLISGNHDIGYAAFNSKNPEIIKRYETEFGARKFKVAIGEFDFIAVDAQTLDGNPKKQITSESWTFLKNAMEGANSNQRVLLTHIPLYRPDWTPCGPHRSSPVINQRIYRAQDQEIVYQNYITEESSKTLLELIRPAMVLSGHDHDLCTVTHMSKHGPIKEHTLGTVSWQQGNLYPSYMLLSARNSTSSSSIVEGTTTEEALLTQICFLPMQTHIYIWYLSLFVMTLVIALFWPANEVRISRKIGAAMSYTSSIFRSLSSKVKEKNEDENCEYEDIWDAEGTMHLIKKTRKISPPAVGGNTVDRGSAVMRANARKGPSTESQTTEHAINVGPVRTSRSRAKMVCWRLLQFLRAILIIAALNLPLYVFLVFKDWI